MTGTAIPDLARDYLDLDGLLSPEERSLRDDVRAFVDERVRPPRPAHRTGHQTLSRAAPT